MQEVCYINEDDLGEVNYILTNCKNARIVNIVPVINPCGAHYTSTPKPFGAYAVIEYPEGEE